MLRHLLVFSLLLSFSSFSQSNDLPWAGLKNLKVQTPYKARTLEYYDESHYEEFGAEVESSTGLIAEAPNGLLALFGST